MGEEQDRQAAKAVIEAGSAPRSAQPGPTAASYPAPSIRADRTDAEQTTSAYLMLGARLDELVDVGALTPRRRQGAEFAAWSAVHGLASLLLDGPLRDLPECQSEYAIITVLAAIGRGLQ